MSAEQLPLFPEEETTVPHDEPVTVEWITDADGSVVCTLVAECGCSGRIVQTDKRYTTHDEWKAAIDDALLMTAHGITDLLSEHGGPIGTLLAFVWVAARHNVLRTGWETAMPFTTPHTTHGA